LEKFGTEEKVGTEEKIGTDVKKSSHAAFDFDKWKNPGIKLPKTAISIEDGPIVK